MKSSFTFHRLRRILPGAITVLMAAMPASAEQRIFALVSPNRFATELWEARIDGDQVVEVARRTTANGLGGRPIAADGGRFVVWDAFYAVGLPTALLVYDRVADLTASLPELSARVADPSRARLFVTGGTSIASVTPAGITSLPGTTGLVPVAVAGDGTRLYAARLRAPGPPALYDLVAVDAGTGATLATVPLGGEPRGVAPAADHGSIWVISARPESADVPLLRRLHLPSGQELFAVPLPTVPAPTMVNYSLIGVDEARGRVFVSVSYGTSLAVSSSALLTCEASSGAGIASVDISGRLSAALDRGAGRLLALSQHDGIARFSTISLATGQLISSTALGTTAPLHNVAFAVPPMPPTMSEALVGADRMVTLSWVPAPDLTLGFILEAGSAPGLTNIGTAKLTSGTHVTVPNVPPGTYYVRVKALNYIGASVPSNEAVVTVP
jgi:hypothetical protein